MKKTFFATLFMSMLVIASCNKPQPEPAPTPTPTPTPTEAVVIDSSVDVKPTIAAGGGEAKVSFTASSDWTASIINTKADSWISLDKTSGTAGSATLTIKTIANDTPDDRNATVQIKAGTTTKDIVVTQKGKDALTTTPSKTEFGPEGGEFTIEVKANIDFTYSITDACKDWISETGTKAMTTRKLKFSVAANEEAAKREGSVTIKSSLGEEVIKVYQSGSAPTIILTQSEYAVKAEGETIQVEVRSNVDVDVEIPETYSWIKASTTKAMSTNTFCFDIAPTEEVEPRTGEIRFINKASNLSEKVIITQVQKNALVVAQSSYQVPTGGGTIKIEVGHNVDFDIAIADSWVTQAETKAFTTDKLVFNIAANDTGSNRETNITFTSKDGTIIQQVIVFQPYITFNVSGDIPESVDYKGCKFTLEIEASGVDFEIATSPDAGVGFSYLNPDTQASEWGNESISITNSTSDGYGHYTYDIDLGTCLGTERECHITVTPKNENLEPVIITVHQEEHPDYHVVKALFNACYNKDCGWNEDKRITELPGFEYSILDNDFRLREYSYGGLSGELPECLGDMDHIESFTIASWYNNNEVNNNDLKGSLPSSMSKMTKMKQFRIDCSGLTEIPDIFQNWTSLERVSILANTYLNCNLPKSLCASNTVKRIEIINNGFTGTLPKEWCHSEGYEMFDMTLNRLSGALPSEFFTMKNSAKYFDNIMLQQEGYYFDLSNIETVPGYFSNDAMTDLDGSTFKVGEVVSSAKYTVKLYWATWCPFSKVLLPQLSAFYNKYHGAGLEIIAMNPLDYKEGMTNAELDNIARTEAATKGYNWRNISLEKSNIGNYPMEVPAAVVYDKDGNIVFSNIKAKDTQNRFSHPASTDLISFLESKFGPLDDEEYESTDYSADGNSTCIQAATVGNGINIVIMGDGYTDRDMTANGKYETLMNQAMEEFFAIEPYKSLRDRFNVYYVKVVSKNGKVKEGAQTALSTYFGEGSFIGGDDEKCFEYASHVVSSRNNLLVITLVNGGTSHGCASMYVGDGSSVAYVATNLNERSLFGPTLRHEAGGHGFGKLDDEYSNAGSGTVPQSVIDSRRNEFEQHGMWANTDFTSDPATIKWSKFINDSRYSGEVGIYEGGATYEKGVWRPTEDSMMRNNQEWFNAPSREAIYKRIMTLSGEGYSFDEFLEYDAVNRTATKAAMSKNSKSSKKPVVHGHAPIVYR